MSSLTESTAWKILVAHHGAMAPLRVSGLFAADPERVERFTLESGELLLDYSKHRIAPETMRLLLDLARQRQLPAWTERLFAGEPINHTEHRAVLHMALRSAAKEFPAAAAGPGIGDVMPAVRAVREQMRAFVELAYSGGLRGATGQAITDVVNIGIGGSDLGPRMITRALRRHARGLRLHFVANVDPADFDAVVATLKPETTLFIVASKTFTTVETLQNARRALGWLSQAPGIAARASGHLVAATANTEAARAMGIAPERIFPLWDWVGGRFSVWSAVGLPVALAIGMKHFEALLAGARSMDEHFRGAPLEANMPVILALLGIWYTNFFGAETHAVLPYGEDLRELPNYLQQLEMESNGKQVDRDGRSVDYATAPVLWGAAGTVSQHSFHQLLHQGTHLVPIDFIVPAGADPDGFVASNALAQSAALMAGERGAPHQSYPGNRPSSTLVMRSLSPRALGELIALYEHKVFVQGIIWNVNSFDQWGVELGKRMARSLSGGDTASSVEAMDASTRALAARLLKKS